MKTLTKKEVQAQEVMEATEKLMEMLEKSKHTVYTQIHYVSSSGMTRGISCYIAIDSEIINIDWYLVKLGLFKYHSKGGLKTTGCGMDMAFDMVYTLSSKLYRNDDGSYSHDGAYKLTHRSL